MTIKVKDLITQLEKKNPEAEIVVWKYNAAKGYGTDFHIQCRTGPDGIVRISGNGFIQESDG